jgi:hypothetical protein
MNEMRKVDKSSISKDKVIKKRPKPTTYRNDAVEARISMT